MSKDSTGYMIAGYVVTAGLYIVYIGYLISQKRKWERGGDDVFTG